jgi:hypothetical protein
MKFYVPLLSNIFFVSVVSGLLLGMVYYLAYENAIDALVVCFLLFTDIDMALRSLLDKPSWLVNAMHKKIFDSRGT